jgi:hypothetical protein
MLASAAWAVDLANCAPDLSSCTIPENVLLQFPNGGIDVAGDVIILKPNSNIVSDVFRFFNNIADTALGTGVGNLAILYSGDDNLPLPDPSTYSANAILSRKQLAVLQRTSEMARCIS